MSQKMLGFFQGHERPDKANNEHNSTMRLFSEPDKGLLRARQALFLNFVSWR